MAKAAKSNDPKKLCRICSCANCKHTSAEHDKGHACGLRKRDANGFVRACNCSEFVTRWPCPHKKKM